MKELKVENNKYGIERVTLSIEEGSADQSIIELVIKPGSQPETQKFAENLAFQQDMAVSEGECDLDSFKIILTSSTQIRLIGNTQDIIYLLKSREAIDKEIIAKLEKYIEFFLKQRQAPVTDFFAGEPKSQVESGENKIEVIKQIKALLDRFSENDRKEILKKVADSPQNKHKKTSPNFREPM